MLNIFKYKKLYFDVCNDLANKSLRLDSARSEIEILKEQLKKEKQNLECHQKKSKEKYLWLLETSNKKIQEKTKLQKTNAGKIGASHKKIKKLEEERTQMMDLINSLISENHKILKIKLYML